MHNPPDGVKVTFALFSLLLLAESETISHNFVGLFLECCVRCFQFVSSVFQGSTESNATNDEEEMKGRKGT